MKKWSIKSVRGRGRFAGESERVEKLRRRRNVLPLPSFDVTADDLHEPQAVNASIP